jgi:hypothetical protein
MRFCGVMLQWDMQSTKNILEMFVQFCVIVYLIVALVVAVICFVVGIDVRIADLFVVGVYF